MIVEREFTTQSVHQGYIEPQTSTGLWSSDGRVTIWTATQGIFPIRASTAAILGIPESMIKVIPMEIGGGFGGKQAPYLDPVVALLSKKTGRPVKIAMSRKEVFEGTGPTSGTYMKCKVGADKSGKITAAQIYLAYEAGAFPGSPVAGGAMSSFGPYKVDNLLVDGYDVVVNKQKTSAYRAPGQPQAAYAAETVIDELAEKLGMDPMDFRLKNAVHEGDRTPAGVLHVRFGCEEIEQAMKAHPSLQRSSGRPQPWARRCRWLPAERRRQRVVGDHKCQCQWNHQSHHRVGGHWRNAVVHCHAGCRGAGHRL